jgi:hypothetical protein
MGVICRALASVFWTGTPIIVAVVTFAIFTLTGGELTAEIAFTALGKILLVTRY